jgi:uncharacterized RDD family membrane protein YckC
MTRLRSVLAALMLAASVTATGAQSVPPPPSGAQPEAVDPQVPNLPPAPELPDAPPAVFGYVFDARGSRGAVHIGQDLNIAAGDTVREAVVIFGNATIAGQVDNNVVVILGTVRLMRTAIVGGDFVAVGGKVTAESGASIRGNMVVVGGDLETPDNFTPGGEHVVIGSGIPGEWLDDVAPYFVRGLLWGRLIVPDLAWMWVVVALFFLVYFAINLMLDGPVRACASTLEIKPLTAFGVGLLVLLLFGPVSLLLAVSVIGLAVVPFLVCALLAGWLVGKVAVARWIGMSAIAEAANNRVHATRSFLIGFVLITIAYMIPVIGVIGWGLVSVLGLGAASLAFFSAYRRENPKPVTPVPTAYVPSAAAMTHEAKPAMAYEAVAPPPGAAVETPPPVMSATAGGATALVLPHALFRERLGAFVLDVILVAITVKVLPVDNDVFLPFLLIYHIGFWTWKQTTVGGTICQLRVVRVDGEPLSFADALVRGLSAIFSMAVFFIGALWILRDPERQAWHDKIAGTYVVKVPRNWPL